MWWKVIIVFGSIMLLGAGCTTSNDWYNLEQDKLMLERNKETRLVESELFDRKIRCQDMVDRFKKRYNNVTGGSYDELSNSCEIEHRSGRSKETSDMESMSDN